MIHGIISDSSFFSAITDCLSDYYTVITYDRCGYGDAPAANTASDYTICNQAADAFTVLKQCTSEPAWIFGNSAGSQIALELCKQHPEAVRGLILLEPALPCNSSSLESLQEWNQELNTYVESGRIKKALPAFARITGGTQAVSSGQGQSLKEMQKTYKNLHNFMYGELNFIQRYEINPAYIEQLHVPVRIVITEDGRNMLFGKVSSMTAEALGLHADYFPGYHNTVNTHPTECAKRLRLILEEMDNGI